MVFRAGNDPLPSLHLLPARCPFATALSAQYRSSWQEKADEFPRVGFASML